MGKKYHIKYKFRVENVNNNIENISINYWESRRFKCKLSKNRIIGHRGNTFGNLFSFDMTKLICELQMEFSDNCILVEFIVNGKFQDITEVNLTSFKIEQLLFPYYLNNIPTPDFLNDFLDFRKQSALMWTFSFMNKGRLLSEELREKIESLVNGNELPEVKIE